MMMAGKTTATYMTPPLEISIETAPDDEVL
jgi:hypothetical protein